MDRNMPDEQFLPETIDEQVESLLQNDDQHVLPSHSNARLVRTLATTYQENRYTLEQVWQRLATHPAVTQMPGNAPPPFHERTSSMQPIIIEPSAHPGRQRLSILVASLITLLLIGSTLTVFVLARQSSIQPASNGQTPIEKHTVAATSTSCPAAGTARAIVTAPLAQGNHTTLVYLVIDSRASTLQRYDLATGRSTEIAHLPGVTITSAQVSADGQWVLFTTDSRLQVVRIDGQGLQTLYCDPTGSNFQWSANQQLIAFESKEGSTGFIKLLHVADGAITTALTQPLNTPRTYHLRTWLDASRLYLTRTDKDVPPDALAILDLNRGLNQSINALISVVKPDPGMFQDFDSSFDGKQVFIAESPCTYACSGSGNIIEEPALGGAPLTFFASQYSIVQLRVATPKDLLFLTENRGFPDRNTGDLSHNGLWVCHSDGRDTRITRLTTDNANQSTIFNAYSQYPWSNVSRDTQWYAAEQDTSQSNGRVGTATLSIGSLNGGDLRHVADMSDGTQLHIVGWTTL